MLLLFGLLLFEAFSVKFCKTINLEKISFLLIHV